MIISVQWYLAGAKMSSGPVINFDGFMNEKVVFSDQVPSVGEMMSKGPFSMETLGISIVGIVGISMVGNSMLGIEMSSKIELVSKSSKLSTQ